MNTILCLQNKQLAKGRQLLLLVGLLLLLPFAQAQHLATHDITTSDIKCQICISSIDIDGQVPDSPQTFAFIGKHVDADQIRIDNPNLGFRNHSAIRAPPAKR